MDEDEDDVPLSGFLTIESPLADGVLWKMN